MSTGKSVHHESGVGHVTGESIFVDDRPQTHGEIQVGFVGSPVSAGELLEVDASRALKIPGVLAVYTAKDLPHNQWGTIVSDQPLLVEKTIGYIDEPVCIVAAESRQALREARKAIDIRVKESKPEEGVLSRSQGLVRGDAAAAMAAAPHRISGVYEIAGQEHFYLESQASIVYPLENNQLEVHSSSQHPTEVQHVCAEILGLRQNQVICIVKRMGGAFGGKESQAAPFAAMAALVAHKLKKPARIALDKDDDMRVTGKRHPFRANYEIGFDDQGRILAFDVFLYADGGAYIDLSPSVLERAVFHVDGSYYIPHMRVQGLVRKTNTHSNTAFRGFGGPQGNMVIENALEEIAIYLKKDAAKIRQINLYGKTDRNLTHYDQPVENNLLPEIFEQLLRSSDYFERSAEIRKHNQGRTQTLRGIAITGCKFGIAFNARHLNQASALVHVHQDGTVQVSTGMTEMGQGGYTKIQQIVAAAFSIPTAHVQVMATSTEKNANTSPTAASSGTDLNGAAALKACESIKNRLQWVAHCKANQLSVHGEFPPIDPKASISHYELSNWQELVQLAYRNRFSLSELGYFRTEGLTFDLITRKGSAFKYFTQGAAVSEVEIDEYTGALKIRRTDILMDLGRMINPGIDRGQTLGAFVQGAGWMTTENLWYDAKGRLGSHSPTTYKIPNIQDMPRDFRVDFIENPHNTKNVYGSKAVGEPPLLLSASVLMAVKNALSDRTGGIPKIEAPATAEKILMELSQYEL